MFLRIIAVSMMPTAMLLTLIFCFATSRASEIEKATRPALLAA